MKRNFCVHRVFPMPSRPGLPGKVDLSRPPVRARSLLAAVILVLASGLPFTQAVFASTWETSAMRTPGGGLVRVGMSRQEVLNELGKHLILQYGKYITGVFDIGVAGPLAGTGTILRLIKGLDGTWKVIETVAFWIS